jgi:hypothetical protein
LIESRLDFTLKQTDQAIQLVIPKNDSAFSIDNPVTNNLFKLEPKTCNPALEGEYRRELLEDGSGTPFLRLTSVHADSCLVWSFPDLPLDRGWLISLVYRHQKGYPLLTAGFDGLGRYKYFYTKLQQNNDWDQAHLIVPPYSTDEQGVAISLSNVSFNRHPSVNDLASLRINQIPWDYAKSVHFIKQEADIIKNDPQPLEFQGGYWHYTVSLPENGRTADSTLTLPQSYDRGWLAFGVENGRPRLLKHFLINNWANAWDVSGKSEKIYLVFWPQLLQYLGFLLLALTPLALRRFPKD